MTSPVANSSNSDVSLLPAEDNLISGDFNPQNKEILKYIDKHIKLLGPDSLIQVCNIIKRNMEKYTVKKDCVLLNLGSFKPETIRELVRFITFIKNNQTLLDEDEILKTQLKTQNNLSFVSR